MIFVGEIFEEIYDLEKGLNKVKVEEDDYDEMSQASKRSSQAVRLARNQEKMNSIDRLIQELLKLEQNFLRYLNDNDSDFEDVGVGHVVTETGLFFWRWRVAIWSRKSFGKHVIIMTRKNERSGQIKKGV